MLEFSSSPLRQRGPRRRDRDASSPAARMARWRWRASPQSIVVAIWFAFYLFVFLPASVMTT